MLSAQESWSYSSETWLDSNYRQRLKKIANKYTRGTGISWEDAVQNANLKTHTYRPESQQKNFVKFTKDGKKDFLKKLETLG